MFSDSVVLGETGRIMNKKASVRRDDIAAFLAIALVYIVMELCGITCPILFFTGISCGGCGMSRACLAAIHGDLSQAFYYHPLFPLLIPAGLCFLYRRHFSDKTKKILLTLLCAAFLLVYLIRMFIYPNDIVFCHPSDGLIGKTVLRIYHLITDICSI